MFDNDVEERGGKGGSKEQEKIEEEEGEDKKIWTVSGASVEKKILAWNLCGQMKTSQWLPNMFLLNYVHYRRVDK